MERSALLMHSSAFVYSFESRSYRPPHRDAPIAPTTLHIKGPKLQFNLFRPCLGNGIAITGKTIPPFIEGRFDCTHCLLKYWHVNDSVARLPASNPIFTLAPNISITSREVRAWIYRYRVTKFVTIDRAGFSPISERGEWTVKENIDPLHIVFEPSRRTNCESELIEYPPRLITPISVELGSSSSLYNAIHIISK